MKHLNFYENLKEANMRLANTVVLYEREPYHVHTITNHKPDGVFRVYMSPTGLPFNPADNAAPYQVLPQEHPSMGISMDAWLDEKKDSRILRKMMNSKHFNNFRPFPLGMYHGTTGTVYYAERSPTRRTEQGLSKAMIVESRITLTPGKSGRYPEIHSPEFREMILGNYPSAQEVLANLNDPDVVNEAAAFSRYFALVRGPIGTLFLAYKEDIVGILPNSDFSSLRLAKPFRHTREVIEDLNVFTHII